MEQQKQNQAAIGQNAGTDDSNEIAALAARVAEAAAAHASKTERDAMLTEECRQRHSARAAEAERVVAAFLEKERMKAAELAGTGTAEVSSSIFYYALRRAHSLSPIPLFLLPLFVVVVCWG